MTSPNSVVRIGDGSDWRFVNGEWEDTDEGCLRVREEARRVSGDNMQGHHYAFHTGKCYADVRVRFEFRLTPHSDAGIILRARDRSHFYLLHFPNCGQAFRAQHFWVAFSRMDESGYLRRIKMEMVRRVPSNSGVWLKAALTLSGDTITATIGDHGCFEARDEAYADAGQIGVYSFGDADIRNLALEGDQLPSCSWDDEPQQATNWYYPCPDTEYGKWQEPRDLLRLADGTLLLNYAVQEEPYRGKITPLLTRSADGGRTWSTPELLQVPDASEVWFQPRLHITPAGRLIYIIKREEEYVTAESVDGARTWSQSKSVEIGPKPPLLKGLHLGPQAFLNLADGSMVLFGYGGCDLGNPDLAIYTWGSLHCQAFACRSTDDGRTWSSLVNVDDPGRDPEGNLYEGNLDLTEVCGAQMGNGRIMALIRPVYSPWMWETWSDDGGATWGPCVRGPFAGYATPNMLRTVAGAVLVAHRLPSMTIHCSLDEGHSWDQGTMIDSAIWVMGSMLEVEPDVVLFAYWDSYESLMRMQRIRVTPAGLQPIRPGE